MRYECGGCVERDATIARLKASDQQIAADYLAVRSERDQANATIARLTYALRLVQTELDDTERDGSDICFGDSERAIIAAALTEQPSPPEVAPGSFRRAKGILATAYREYRHVQKTSRMINDDWAALEKLLAIVADLVEQPSPSEGITHG